VDIEVAARIAAAHGLGEVLASPEAAARGEQGRIWRLTTSSGVVALKELWIRQEEAGASADVAFQRLALAGGLPMPAPIVRRDGAILTELDGGRLQVRLYTWVELTNPDTPPTIDVGGALLGRLHALARPAGGAIDPWYTEPVGAHRWTELHAEARAVRAAWLDVLETCLPAALDGERIVVATDLAHGPESERRRAHLDFNIDNVLLDASGSAVIVDWENSGPATDDGELIASATDFAPDADGAARFVRAYREAGGRAQVGGAASFALAIAVQNHLIESYARRALAPDASDEDRQRSAWRLGQIADNLLTRPRIDELVEILRVL
jgi:Ser/Thr protein kinase RdoA (MazF antagonist)